MLCYPRSVQPCGQFGLHALRPRRYTCCSVSPGDGLDSEHRLALKPYEPSLLAMREEKDEQEKRKRGI
jgi:hypothetical protein